MPTFAVLTRLAPEALQDPAAVERLGNEVSAKLKERCPEAKWVASYWVLGPCDYLDIYDVPDAEAASKVALIIRSFGHATTETWGLTPWSRYLEVAKSAATPPRRRRGRPPGSKNKRPAA